MRSRLLIVVMAWADNGMVRSSRVVWSRADRMDWGDECCIRIG